MAEPQVYFTSNRTTHGRSYDRDTDQQILRLLSSMAARPHLVPALTDSLFAGPVFGNPAASERV